MAGDLGAAVVRLRRSSGVFAALVAAPELSRLPAPERAGAAGLRVVELTGSQLVHGAGRPVIELVFPVDCVVAEAVQDGGSTVEVTTVGCEGVVGLAGLLGATVHDTRAVCRVPGQALVVPVEQARRLLSSGPGVAAVQACTLAVVRSLLQRVVCNRVHSSDQRCASWLLQTQDRVGRDAYALTQATLAQMLGVRRATVSNSLADLQRRRVVRSARGVLTVLDREVLEASACACYQVNRQAFASPLD